MPFEIRVTRTFCASHQVKLPGGGLEPIHGHNWNVTLTVAADALDASGFVVDFHELERRLDAVVGPMNNRHLNDLPPFGRSNTSAECVALAIAENIHLPPGVKMAAVEVTEAPGCVAVYRLG
jgi:6-pyruvoyltetrahydropterin/6-carboxytetrahydropterin synthase